MQSLSDERTISTTFLSFYFGNGAEVARCCIPFKSYARKLANNASKVSVMYSKLDAQTIILSFNTVRALAIWSQDTELFEASLKRMYNEFAKESKSGGGGLQVQDSLRIV